MKRYIGLLSCLCCSVAIAKTDNQPSQLIKKSTMHASVTLGYGGIENPVVNADDITSPILPSFAYYGDSWYFDNFALGYSLIEESSYFIDILGRFNDDGFFFELDGIENLFVTGSVSSSPGRPSIPSATPITLNPIKRDLSYMVGVSSAFNIYKDIWLDAALLNDVTDVHNGHEFQLSGYRTFEFKGTLVSVEAGAIYKSGQLTKYYYTVAPFEAKARLPKYELRSAVNYHLKLGFEYPINDSFSADFKIKYTWLDSHLANSQMIDKKGYFSGFSGITYHF